MVRGREVSNEGGLYTQPLSYFSVKMVDTYSCESIIRQTAGLLEGLHISSRASIFGQRRTFGPRFDHKTLRAIELKKCGMQGEEEGTYRACQRFLRLKKR
jgi:hypothetical protein